MMLDTAVAVVRQFQRYRDRGCTKRHPHGALIRNIFVPKATALEFRQAVDAQKYPCGKTVWVEISALRGLQRCLGRARLIRQLRWYPSKKLPIIVKLPGGKWYLWDGNHRVASAVLLGKRRVRCLMIGEIKA